MRTNLVSFLIVLALIAIITILIYDKTQTTNEFKTKSFEEKRSEILSEIDITLKEATETGKYKCCIEPACKMCFLGNWIWKDGTCDCDTLIAEEKWDDVCPECKRGIEEGKCISTLEGTCSVNEVE